MDLTSHIPRACLMLALAEQVKRSSVLVRLIDDPFALDSIVCFGFSDRRLERTATFSISTNLDSAQCDFFQVVIPVARVCFYANNTEYTHVRVVQDQSQDNEQLSSWKFESFFSSDVTRAANSELVVLFCCGGGGRVVVVVVVLAVKIGACVVDDAGLGGERSITGTGVDSGGTKEDA
nr:hypothetical protein [Tanacetum cinerariifolium]